jgi:hypothetical protein
VPKLIAIVVLGAILLVASAPPADANGAVAAALALGAFAMFTTLAWAAAWYPPLVVSPVVYPPPYAYAPAYAAPPTTYAPAPSAAAAAPAIQREVVFPNGRYVLYGDGVTVAYQWVWLSTPTIPPPPSGAPPAPPVSR